MSITDCLDYRFLNLAFLLAENVVAEKGIDVVFNNICINVADLHGLCVSMYGLGLVG